MKMNYENTKLHKSPKARDLCISVKGMKQYKRGKDCIFYLDEGQLHAPQQWLGMETSPVFYIQMDGEFMVYTPTLGIPKDQAHDKAVGVIYDLRNATAIYPWTPYRQHDPLNLPPCKVIESRVPTQYALAFSGGFEAVEEGAVGFAGFKHPRKAVRKKMLNEYLLCRERQRAQGVIA